MNFPILYNITFSDIRSNRWKRHLFFWLAVFAYHLMRIGIMVSPIKDFYSLITLLEYSLFRGVISNIFFTYFIVYYLIPKFFNRKKYISFSAGILVSIILLQVYGIFNDILHSGSFEAINFARFTITVERMRPGFIRLFGNPPLICGLFLSLKILKNWHLEQLRTETLAKENTNAELQLLKAQVHPHFLFNTLNNIYSFSLTQSPLAGTLVQKLSDMLKYMIDECEKPLVPLEKEIKLIRDYMGLEKVRYGNRLTMEVEINGSYENKMIAPLLMIPFVENCFKHGASIMRGQQWINLSILINEDRLEFNLSNSKPMDVRGTKNNKGIGLANVQKRLKLLYPGKHFLKIESTSDTFNIHLDISLQQVPVLDSMYELIPKLQTA